MPRVTITELSPQLRDYAEKLEYSSEFLLKISAEYAEAFLKENKMSDSPSNSEGSIRVMSKLITYAPCPNCSLPLASDEVYRAGYEHAGSQHPMLRHLPPRGSYCNHIKYSDSCHSTTEDQQ